MQLNQDLDLSFTEENYLKSIFSIGFKNGSYEAGTNDLADYLSIKPASVNEMLKKLSEKKLVHYKKYEKTKLTELGTQVAKDIIRKHRLWETFLFQKLDFSWDEVHKLAEELEHIKSKKLINKLDEFLGKPKFDPHGDPIPNEEGNILVRDKKKLSEVPVGEICEMIAVRDNTSMFLKYVDSLGLALNSTIKVIDRQAFDELTTLQINDELKTVSHKFCENIYVITKENSI